MKHVDEVTDDNGAWVRVDIRPGTTLDDPKVITITIKDEVLSSVTFTREQTNALIDVLEQAIWECL